MLSVTIRKWNNATKSMEEIGQICLVNGHIQCYPANEPRLLTLLSDPIGGNMHHPEPVSAFDNPKQFLENLQYTFKSPYLRASAPKETLG